MRLKENARQGYWNGAPPPCGHRAIAVETRRKKRRLEIDPVEAETVREVFDLCRAGRGIRAIADHLASGLG